MKKSCFYLYIRRVHADFETKTVSWQLKEKDGEVLAQQLNVPTDAVNLAKINACSWWDSKPQYIDNFRLTAPAENIELSLKGKTVYAFGDSIVAGHKYEKASFANFTAGQEGMNLQKFAVNGATVMDAGYSGGQIVSQIVNAPTAEPDFVLFDGGTNDAEYIAKNSGVQYGSVSDSKDGFDTLTFAGAFEKTVSDMKQKWPGAQLVYVAVHKLGGREMEVQEKLHEIEMQICEKWGIAVANLYEDAELDTSDVNQKNQYTFDDVSANGLPGINGSGTHPNLAAIEEFYVPIVSAVLRDPSSHIPAVKPESVNKDELAQAIQTAKDKVAKTDVYTEESITALAGKISKAEEILNKDNATQDEVDEQAKTLKAAILELEPIEPTPDKPDRTGLVKKMNEAKAEAAKTDAYTEESITALTEEISKAEEVLNKDDALQDEIDAQIAALQAAIDKLDQKKSDQSDPKPEIKRTALLDKLETAGALAVSEGVYTDATMAALEQAISVAEVVLNNPNATQEEVDAQVAALQTAIDGLIKVKPADQDDSGQEEEKPDSVI